MHDTRTRHDTKYDHARQHPCVTQSHQIVAVSRLTSKAPLNRARTAPFPRDNAQIPAAVVTTASGKASTVAISAPRVPRASNHQLMKINAATANATTGAEPTNRVRSIRAGLSANNAPATATTAAWQSQDGRDLGTSRTPSQQPPAHEGQHCHGGADYPFACAASTIPPHESSSSARAVKHARGIDKDLLTNGVSGGSHRHGRAGQLPDATHPHIGMWVRCHNLSRGCWRVSARWPGAVCRRVRPGRTRAVTRPRRSLRAGRAGRWRAGRRARAGRSGPT